MTSIAAHFEKHKDHDLVSTHNWSDYGDDQLSAEARGSMDVWYDATIAAHGTGSILYWEAGNTGNGYASEYFGNFNASQAVMRFYIRLTGLPPANTGAFGFAEFRSSDSTSICTLDMDSAGKITFDGLGLANPYVSTVALAPLKWYRVEVAAKVSTTAGQLKFAIYSGDATTSSIMSHDSATTLNTGTKAINASVVGKNYGGLVPRFNVDDWEVRDGTMTYFGPYVPGPTVIATANQGVAVIDCTRSYPGTAGDALTFSISPNDSDIKQPARGVFLVPETSNETTFTITATESTGQTDSQSVLVPPQFPGGLGFKQRVFQSGTWKG